MNYQGIIDNIIDLAGDKMNDWEIGFVDSLFNKLYDSKLEIKTRYELTKKQKECLLKIQDKYLKHN